MHAITGFRAFLVVWLGESVSLVGTAMTRFALTIWAYEQTSSATALALVGFFSFAPMVLLSPVAGALVDRWNRKTVMIAADLAAGLSTVTLLLLHTAGQLQFWHLCVAGAFAGIFEAFQFPAFSASITVMVSRDQYARVSGMRSLSDSASMIAAPILAGIVLSTSGLTSVMTIDIVTFLVAVSALLVIHIPQPEATAAGKRAQGSLWKESLYGFQYILERPSLLGMQLIFFLSNLFFMLGSTLLAPMVLARTGSDELQLGGVQAAMGLGGVIGGVLLSIWGGPKRKAHGVFIGMALSSLFGQMTIGLGQGLFWWSAGAFLSMFFLPLINGSNQAIWQSKVAPDVQGRVFAVRLLIAQITAPLAMFIAGPLADQVFEPAMRPAGPLAPLFGGLVGTGPGAGMALIFVLTGALGIFSGLLGYVFPVIRNIETILPDYEPAVRAEPQPVTGGQIVEPTPAAP